MEIPSPPDLDDDKRLHQEPGSAQLKDKAISRSLDFIQTASIDLVNLNNEIVRMRAVVKKSRVHVINKLHRMITSLKKKKGTEEQLLKNYRKIARLLKEIQLLKNLKPDNISKFALGNRKSFSDISKLEVKTEMKALTRLSEHPEIQKRVQEFRKLHPDWPSLAAFLQMKQTGRRFKKKNKKKSLQRPQKLNNNIEASRTLTRMYLEDRFGPQAVKDAEMQKCKENNPVKNVTCESLTHSMTKQMAQQSLSSSESEDETEAEQNDCDAEETNQSKADDAESGDEGLLDEAAENSELHLEAGEKMVKKFSLMKQSDSLLVEPLNLLDKKDSDQTSVPSPIRPRKRSVFFLSDKCSNSDASSSDNEEQTDENIEDSDTGEREESNIRWSGQMDSLFVSNLNDRFRKSGYRGLSSKGLKQFEKGKQKQWNRKDSKNTGSQKYWQPKVKNAESDARKHLDAKRKFQRLNKDHSTQRIKHSRQGGREDGGHWPNQQRWQSHQHDKKQIFSDLAKGGDRKPAGGRFHTEKTRNSTVTTAFEIHPSWQASQKRKQETSIQTYQGKRIKFSDDD